MSKLVCVIGSRLLFCSVLLPFFSRSIMFDCYWSLLSSLFSMLYYQLLMMNCPAWFHTNKQSTGFHPVLGLSLSFLYTSCTLLPKLSLLPWHP
jgi:cytochrome c biogenesis protein CcdA